MFSKFFIRTKSGNAVFLLMKVFKDHHELYFLSLFPNHNEKSLKADLIDLVERFGGEFGAASSKVYKDKKLYTLMIKIHN